MERQLRTQELSSKFNAVKGQIKENLNYIYIVLMILANALLSLLHIQDGKIGLNYPNGALAWVLWCTQVLAVTFIGVMILSSFRRQGIKNGHAHTEVKDSYDKYLSLISKQTTDSNPRSLKEYMNQRAVNDSLSKGTIFAIVNVLVISIGIGANWNSLMALIINILLATCFGIKAMLDAEDFVITELIVWYKLKIKEMEEKANGKLRRNTQSRSRSTESSGVQQEKECRTGQSDSELDVSVESVVIPSASRVST